MKNIDTSEVVKIVQDYSGYIKNLCRRFYLVGGTTDDLYQEGIIGLLEACKNYNGNSLFEAQFDAFAKLCIKRQIFDAIKKTQSKKNKALNESISLVGVSESGDEISKLDIISDRTTISDPLEMFLDKEKFNEEMELCERELSDFEKLVLSHYLSGEKQSEIAQKLNKNVKSIDNTLQRIKNKLK
jgi:RNA polymerase sporulation-specific sigma factor